MRLVRWGVAIALAVLLGGCATLAQGVLPPQFSVAQDRQSEVLLMLPSAQRPLGGATVRLWARVQNPNAFGLMLAALDGSLYMEQNHAARVDFPLGVPLAAAADTVIPVEIAIDFADVPGLGDALRRAVVGAPVAYRLDGRVTVDAGLLGRPVFGPSTLLQGEVQTRR